MYQAGCPSSPVPSGAVLFCPIYLEVIELPTSHSKGGCATWWNKAIFSGVKRFARYNFVDPGRNILYVDCHDIPRRDTRGVAEHACLSDNKFAVIFVIFHFC